jgi:hypothetical protein
VIKRDPNLKNDMLASEHDRLVGNAILDKLTETFGNGASAIPKMTTANASEDGTRKTTCQCTCIFFFMTTLTILLCRFTNSHSCFSDSNHEAISRQRLCLGWKRIDN